MTPSAASQRTKLACATRLNWFVDFSFVVFSLVSVFHARNAALIGATSPARDIAAWVFAATARDLDFGAAICHRQLCKNCNIMIVSSLVNHPLSKPFTVTGYCCLRPTHFVEKRSYLLVAVACAQCKNTFMICIVLASWKIFPDVHSFCASAAALSLTHLLNCSSCFRSEMACTQAVTHFVSNIGPSRPPIIMPSVSTCAFCAFSAFTSMTHCRHNCRQPCKDESIMFSTSLEACVIFFSFSLPCRRS
mmetsp:Transcript_45247/g.129798  ORF Transcript_45247/g.129798 Transcript_45247/m.129798 type:complete len:248 (-) Transcript_45247:1785-2528(-)